jgi:HPt (histidine-containing phosphotransfer) domain-containing protein
MTGQLERCLQSGMDGLLTKPLDPERLRDTLERFGLRGDEDTIDEAAVERLLGAPESREVLDTPALRELVRADPQFARELLEEYAAASRRLATGMNEAAASGDIKSLGKQAHELQGASANVYAHGVAAACASLQSEAPHMTPERLKARTRDIKRLVLGVCQQLDLMVPSPLQPDHTTHSQAVPSTDPSKEGRS